MTVKSPEMVYFRDMVCECFVKKNRKIVSQLKKIIVIHGYSIVLTSVRHYMIETTLISLFIRVRAKEYV